MTNEGIEGIAVLNIPTLRVDGERGVKKGREEPDVIEERGNEEQKGLLCPVTTRKVVISHED